MAERPASQSLAAAVRRRLGLVLVCALLVPAAAYGISKTIDPKYEATSTLLFREQPLQSGLRGLSPVLRDTDAGRELSTSVELASLDVVAERTAKRVGGGVSGEDVMNDVTVSAKSDADIVEVQAQASSGVLAARLANEFARELIAFRRRTDVQRIRSAQRRIEDELAALDGRRAQRAGITRRERRARRATLRRRARNLDVLAAVQGGRAEVVQAAAVPNLPFSPKTRTNVLVGGALGLLLGLSLALFVDRLDRRLRGPEEAEQAFGIPIIGAIPRSAALADRRDQTRLPADEREPFRSLRTNLCYLDSGEELSSILVTSPSRGDGRTTTALHLAIAAAEAGTRVLLVEADLRRPRLHQLLGPFDDGGLVRALTSRHDLSEDVQRVELTDDAIRPANGGSPMRVMDVISAGRRPHDPSRLLASERMRELLSVAQERYELVVIDAPPPLAVSDAVPLMAAVSGTIVVVRVRHTGRGDLHRLAELLQNLRTRPIGLVVNDSERIVGLHGSYSEKPVTRNAISA